MSNNPVRLSLSALRSLSARDVRIPTYDRQKLVLSTVHVGVGGFHRAHQAAYLEDLLNTGGTLWGECGVGLLPQDAKMKHALQSQDRLYTVFTRGQDEERCQVVGVIARYLHAPESPDAVLEQMAAPETRIVSLTVTEGGYYLIESSGDLDGTHPDLTHDLENPGHPRSVLGYLAEALDRRRCRGLGPFTVLSCDNLPGNGDVSRKSLLSFASLRDENLRSWIESNVTFPNAMVDGITPVTRDSDREALEQRFGIRDAWPVVTEPFRQWVLADEFCNGRPAWEEVGVQFTSDVAPYERMKLRLLNAGHSALGYLGALLGLEYVHEAASHPILRPFLAQFFNEVKPLIPHLLGVDVNDYTQTLIQRFSNPAIRDQLSRICSEGSAKLPKFVLPSIKDLRSHRRSHRTLDLVIAAWLLYLTGKDERGCPLAVLDARKDELLSRISAAENDAAVLLKMTDLFGTLSEDPAWISGVSRFTRQLREQGVERTLEALHTGLKATDRTA